jgi:hypothetical protein
MNKVFLLFLIILIEGYVVLACELLAIRQLIPFVGSGTETISIVISAVLLPLAIGYHWGGKAYSRAWQKHGKRGKKQLSIRKLLVRNILSAMGILTLGLSYLFMEMFFAVMITLGIEHRLPQTALYTGIFLVYPVFLLGQTVPLISNYFSRQRLSEITGKMLFFSTAGSFLGSVFSTIVLMTFIGVHYTVIVTLGLLTLLCLLLTNRKMLYESFLCTVMFLTVYFLNNGDTFSQLHIVSNNAYNTIRVLDLPEEEAKVLNINQSTSSKIAKDRRNMFDYLRYIQNHLIDGLPQDDAPHDILVIGAGGFTVGIDDTVNHYVFIDIDKDLKKVSEEHFLPEPLTPNKKFVAASAREFVRRDKNLYDLIILDAYTNIMSIPMEAVTRDFLVDVKKRLKPGGIVAANVIMNPTFRDKFSVRYHNTFTSVFPTFTRQVIGGMDAWGIAGNKKLNNVIYLYFNHDLVEDRTVYTDDKNTYSLDRN